MPLKPGLLGVLVLFAALACPAINQTEVAASEPRALFTSNGNQEFLIDPNRPLLYYGDKDGDSLSLVNTSTGQVIATITVGTRPSSIDLSADGARLYVALSGDTKVAVVDIAGRTVIETIELGFAPWSVRELRPGRLVVTGATDALVHLVDEANGATVASVASHYSLSTVEASPGGDAILVVEMNTSPPKIDRFGVSGDTLILEARDDHDLGGNTIAVDWTRGVFYIVPNWPPGLAVVSVTTLDVVGNLTTDFRSGLPALSPEGDIVYSVSGGLYEDAVLWGFETSTRTLIGTQVLPAQQPQFIGVPRGGEHVVIAEPLQAVSLLSSVYPVFPQPDAIAGYSPPYVEASFVKGIRASTISHANVSLNGVVYEARVLPSESAREGILRLDLSFVLNDGLWAVTASFIGDNQTAATGWTFTVDSTLPVPGVEFEVFEHSLGFRVPVPRDWERRVDQEISGVTFELALHNRTYVPPASILIVIGLDPDFREDPEFLQGLVNDTLGSVQSGDSSARLMEGPVFREISNHGAVSFAVIGSDEKVLKVAIVVSELHDRWWSLLLTAGLADFGSANAVFEHMLYRFEITAVPPGVPLWPWLIPSLILGVSGSGILAFWAIWKSRTPAPPDGTKGRRR